MNTDAPTPEEIAAVETARGVKLTAAGLYHDRNVMHRNMGPPELFPCCGGAGWFSASDLYCPNEACAARSKRKRILR